MLRRTFSRLPPSSPHTYTNPPRTTAAAKSQQQEHRPASPASSRDEEGKLCVFLFWVVDMCAANAWRERRYKRTDVSFTPSVLLFNILMRVLIPCSVLSDV